MAYKFSKGNRGFGDIAFEDDSDTGIDFEADTVKIETGGSERLVVTNSDITLSGDVGIGTTSPIAKLDVAGKIAITAESSTPSQPSDGQGYLYTKTDGKIYWRSYDVAETDLTAVGEGGGAPATLVLMAHVSSDFNVTTTSQNEYLTVPFDSVLKTTFAGSDFNTSTHTFTAPEEGYYFINCSLFHNSISATPTQYQIRISSSADWGYGGAIAFRNFFPGAMAETTTHTHRLDRIAHLSGSDEVKITIRPVAGAGSYGKIVGLPHVSYLTIHKL